MLALSKSSRVANVLIDDYAVRVIENNGKDLTSIKFMREQAIPSGLIENGRIIDEFLFFEVMKDIVEKWDLKNRYVSFYVPDSLVVMRNVDYPANLDADGIKEHFLYEIGQSIHLPFDNPLYDIHPLSQVAATAEEGAEATKEGMMFAVPEDEVRKFTDVFVDASLQPLAADVRALGNYRYFHQMHLGRSDNVFQVYLFIELNLNSLNVSIFHNHQLEFLRHQPLDIDIKNWTYSEAKGTLQWEYRGNEDELLEVLQDQVSELDRVMNFYNFSINKGQKNVTQFVLLGDNPYCDKVAEMIKNRYELPLFELKAYETEEKLNVIGQQFIPVLGLALKGGE